MAAARIAAARRGLVLSPDDGAGVGARAVLRFHLRAFAREEGRARAGEVEPVHQLRVATRRLRATLRLFAPVLSGPFAPWAQREVAWLGHAIGAVRDLDVLAAATTAQAARLDPELRAALGPLALAIHEQRTAAQAALVAALDSKRARRLLDRLAAFADTPAAARREPRLGDVAAELIRPHLRAVVRAGRRAEETAAPEALHRLRVRVKRLRYALETLGALGEKGTAKLLRRLARLQDVLGEHQDAVTEAAWLRRWAETPGLPPRTLLALGALSDRLARRARKRRLRFPAPWRRVERRRLRDAVLGELRGGARGRARTLRAVAS